MIGSSLGNLRKPKKLKRGDSIAAVSLSWGGPGTIRERYEIGKRQLESTFGVNVVEMPHTCAPPDFIANNPDARASDLHAALNDSSISGIVSTIGGDDSIRLIPFLDLDLIAQNSKVFLGYSDTTVTHFAFLKAGVRSFYGPSIMAGFAENGGMHQYLIDSVQRTLFESKPIGALAPNPDGWTVELLDWGVPENNTQRRRLNPPTGWRFLQGEGTKRGRLIGGCLEVIDWLRGTSLWPSIGEWRDAIVFIETSEEAPPPTTVTRMLRNLAACGVLDLISGVLFGRPGGQIDPSTFEEYDSALLHAIRDEFGRDDLAIVTSMDFGHTDPTMTLPFGVLTEIDCDEQQITVLEAGVTD
ncbi:MAG: S66 peptidase family protein [Planctomycetota bacterium]